MNTITPININSIANLSKKQYSANSLNSYPQVDSFSPAFNGYGNYQKTIKPCKKGAFALLIATLSGLYLKYKLSPKELFIHDTLKSFPNGIESATPQEIFEKFGISCKKDDNGMLTISHYTPVVCKSSYKQKYTGQITLSDLGVDENKLLKNVKEIEGTADFRYSNAAEIDNLERVGKNLILARTILTDDDEPDSSGIYMKWFNSGSQLPAGGGFNEYVENSNVVSMKNLKTVGGTLYCETGRDINLSSLESVALRAYISDIKGSHLSKLKNIGGYISLCNCNSLNLSNLEKIGGSINIEHCNGLDLSGLKSIGRSAELKNCNNLNLSNLQNINRNCELRNCENIQAQELKSVGGELYLLHNVNVDMNNLDSVGKQSKIDGHPIHKYQMRDDIKLNDNLKESAFVYYQ